MFTKAFWAAAAERATKTFAQTEVALLGAGAINILHIEWQDTLGVSAGAAFVSVLTSIGSSKWGSGDGPSLTNSEVLPPAAP